VTVAFGAAGLGVAVGLGGGFGAASADGVPGRGGSGGRPRLLAFAAGADGAGVSVCGADWAARAPPAGVSVAWICRGAVMPMWPAEVPASVKSPRRETFRSSTIPWVSSCSSTRTVGRSALIPAVISSSDIVMGMSMTEASAAGAGAWPDTWRGGSERVGSASPKQPIRTRKGSERMQISRARARGARTDR
jgi:hypothetical protein